ncbi:MAG: hemin uptake protein HemP [Methylotenera sp.]|uniref:hemin uptake protein HemP n=1 Tax=Methylotenera sp. TaxID=2051956 RepID=UPI0027188D45|nr:hemin uptake protein HemP [Methylotenera sp.]MDO9393762.1 hemin uptake protein HemP [Methylotenera sp.]MDP1524102.1 hemin uptake protein HemP [Methylotenera sp.]MDP3308904.1 hemin uptake protein HemP [Methylotenera sp.]MDZ4211458.1 hemin uptake protein HemP [Methylotenera sp.]
MSKICQKNIVVSKVASSLPQLNEVTGQILKTYITDNGAITSEVLLAGARELVIKHAGEDYRLRLTNQGKLILTK